MDLLNKNSNPEINDLYRYIKKQYYKNDFDNWRDPLFWENEEWEKYLPIEEHFRFEKFRNQACKKFNKGTMEGYHFVEVLEMIDLKKHKYDWLYENYYLFRNARPTEGKFFNGTDKVIQIIGKSKMEMLHDIVSPLNLKPTEPDLFAFKENNNVDNKYDMMFIEVKRDDILSEKQLLGFQLIKKYLDIPIRVVRYMKRSD